MKAYNKEFLALTGVWLIWLGVVPQTKRSPVQFLVRAHAWLQVGPKSGRVQ